MERCEAITGTISCVMLIPLCGVVEYVIGEDISD